MMKRILFMFLLLMFGVAVLPLQAQQYLFSHFNKTESGLSYDSIREIFQDSRGYMWIGTYKGLSRYDGIRFKNYDRRDFGVSSDFINVIREDIEGNLWIGTDNGVVIYSYDADEFKPLAEYLSIEEVPDDRIFAIEKNSQGIIWVSSRDKGLYSFTPKEKIFKHHPIKTIKDNICNNIFRITIDRNDNLYLAIYCDNIYVADSQALACAPLDLADQSSFFQGDDVQGMAISSKSNDIIYVVSKRSGLMEVDVKAKTLKNLCALPKDFRPTNLLLDSNKALWLSTTNGLIHYDLYSNQEYLYINIPQDQFSLSDNYITKCFKDNKGGLWVGTQYGGLNYNNSSHQNFKKFYTLSDGSSLNASIVRDFAEDKYGNLWVATERQGLLKYNLSTSLLEPYTADIPKSVLAVCDDVDYLWLGTQEGISRMKYTSGEIKKYLPFKNEDKDNRVVTIYRSNSNSNKIYVATTIGVMKYYREEDRFEIIPEFSEITIEHMAEDGKGLLWMASYSAGVFTYDLEKEKIISHYSPQSDSSCIPDMISSIYIDDDGTPWVISFSSGFFRYSYDSDSFEVFSEETLSSLPTNVYFMGQQDNFKNLWLSSDSGLVEFNTEKETVRVFSKADGLLDKEFTKSSIKLRSGNLVFGSANGFIIFNPNDLGGKNLMSQVTITDMYLDYQPLTQEQKVEIIGEKTNIDSQTNLSLKFNNNSFGFSFADLTSSYPASDKIFCFLEGHDERWRDVSVDKAIHWTNVPAGKYRLLISCGEFSGYFVDSHKPVFIEIKPKFWASSVGIFLIVLILFILISIILLTILKYQKNRQNKKLEEYRVLKDQEMLKDKMSFFSNIIHEIKTPLTLIRTPLQKIMLSSGLNENLKDELSVISSSTDYMNNLVRELLEFVRLEEHGYVLDIKNVDIVERINFLCFSFSETAKNKNIKLEFTHKEKRLITAVDNAALRKILNNLLDNGVKYADSFIKINLSRDEENVIISFKNDGSNIPDSRRESIFKPFVQFSIDKNSCSQSFGIGLALARNLAELHGGSLFLADNPEHTEFILSLPIKTVEEEVEEDNKDVEMLKRSELPLILIVEDNAHLLNYLKKSLKSEYNVLTVRSAEKALILLKTYKPDIIITDIALEGMSGLELCEKINNNTESSHIPIIVVSAISSTDMKKKCMEQGVMTYIEKPYSMDYLISCIRGALEKKATLKAAYTTTLPVLDNVQTNLLNRDEYFLKCLEKIVLENMSDPAFSNKQLEELLYMGHSTLNRKVKALLDTTPNEYIRTKRLALAAEMLADGGRRINEICYAVGFNSPSYFSKCFKKLYGVLPTEYSKDKNQE